MKKYTDVQGKRHSFSVPITDKGTDVCLLPNHLDDASVSEGVNMVYQEGAFCTRPALQATVDDAVFDQSMNPNWDTECTVTESFVTVSGKKMKVMYVIESDAISFYIVHIFFLAADGTRIKAGKMIFSRSGETSFYEPKNLLFFTGAPILGSGIFAMVSKENLYDEEEKTHQIFELSSDYQTWSEITNFYIPTVLINGRGSSYEYANSLGFAFTGAPKILESKNLLNGSFAAYFTSDRFSSSFRLPFTHLLDCTVTCRVYVSPDVYTDWVILPTQNSTTSRFYSVQITMRIDRTKGILTFYDANGAEYAIERYGRYPENNIRVTASQFNEKDFQDIVSCTCCAETSSKFIFSGGNSPDRVFVSSKDNPFYFPSGSVVSLGNDRHIIALAPVRDGALAFEKSNVYLLRLTQGKAINSHALLSDCADIFYRDDELKFRVVTTAGGCVGKNGVALSGKTPCWVGSDRKIHVYLESSEKETSISKKIEPILADISAEEFANVAVVASEDKILFMFGHRALFLRYRADAHRDADEAQWYGYDFGTVALKGGIIDRGDIRVVCSAIGSNLQYTALLEPGAKDSILQYVNGRPDLSQAKISSSFTTKHYDFEMPHKYKFIDLIRFYASCEGVLQIDLNGKPLERLRLHSHKVGSGDKSVTIHPKSRPVEYAALTFSSDSPFRISDMVFTYREE